MSHANTESFNRTLQAMFNASEKIPAALTKTGDLVIVKVSHSKYEVPLFNVCSVRRFGLGYKGVKLATGQYDFPLNHVEFNVEDDTEVVLLKAQPVKDREVEIEEDQVSVEA